MTIAVYWDVKHQNKQNKHFDSLISLVSITQISVLRLAAVAEQAGFEVIKLSSCSTPLSIKFKLG